MTPACTYESSTDDAPVYAYAPTRTRVQEAKNRTDGYQYAFNGKEDDDATGWQDYGFRNYLKTIGRFASVDPLSPSYPQLTPYQFASNSPISGIDLDGLEYAEAVSGRGLGPLSREALESSEFTIVDSRTLGEGALVQAHLPVASVSATRLPRRNSAPAASSLGGSPFRSSASEHLWKRSVVGSGGGLDISGDVSVAEFEMYSYPVEGPSIAFGVEAHLLSANIDAAVDIGTPDVQLVGSGVGSVLSTSTSLNVGWMQGQEGKRGPLMDINVGAYAAQGDLSGGISIFGTKITGTMGGSLGAVHVGVTGGATYDDDTGVLTIQGIEHVGFGIGEKFGGTIEIPVRDYAEMFREYNSNRE